MFEMLEIWFWRLDLAIATAVTASVLFFAWGTPAKVRIQKWFWLGVAVGLTWEIPLFLSATFAENPVLVMLSSPPIPPLGLIVAHALWDGGLFLAGLMLIALLCPRPILQRFSWRELIVLILWGQGSELMVEVGGVTNNAWGYSGELAWNPTLFHLDGHPITLLPQLIWLAAPIVYYLLALRFTRPGRA
jgi:hypothetical protein